MTKEVTTLNRFHRLWTRDEGNVDVCRRQVFFDQSPGVGASKARIKKRKAKNHPQTHFDSLNNFIVKISVAAFPLRKNLHITIKTKAMAMRCTTCPDKASMINENTSLMMNRFDSAGLNQQLWSEFLC